MIKKEGNLWNVDIRPQGKRNRRIRKTFNTRAEAERFCHWIKTQYIEGKEWNPRQKDKRRLSQLIERWHVLHGTQLKDGTSRKRLLLNAAKSLNDPPATNLSPDIYANYRASRLKAGLTAQTANRELSYFKALFNELIRLNEWKNENPLEGLRAIKTPEKALRFLSLDEITLLMDSLKKSKRDDALQISRVCLTTGARWGEAETLRQENVLTDRIAYGETKSGKVRVIPANSELCSEIRQRGPGRLFKPSLGTFRAALCRSGIDLPKGQMTHVLRHTFASHFVMNGGNILTLQKILGHSEIRMTLRYAHLAPDHLEEARRFNPLNSEKMGHFWDSSEQKKQ